MSQLRLLIVEDYEQDLENCREDVEAYKCDKERAIDLVECKTLDEGLKQLDNSFDGAIIDLKLAPQGDEGNQVIEKIEESFFRIPIAIFTGNPGNTDDNLNEKIMLLGVFIKGETRYYDLLDKFWDIYDTGLTRIMGGRGEIEKLLSKVFLKNLRPQIETWVSYGAEDSERTERALLRYALNHLFQLLEEGEENCFPEEVYLYPPLSEDITTGSIVKEKTNDQQFAVLSPACDLVIRDGESNTDHILLVEIESVGVALVGKRNKNSVESLVKNKRQYRHWLPPTDFFEGGVINFRKLKTVNKADFDDQFETPSIQISPFFVKDIVSRFSSYYARQGQPDIDSKDFVARYTAQQGGGQ